MIATQLVAMAPQPARLLGEAAAAAEDRRELAGLLAPGRPVLGKAGGPADAAGLGAPLVRAQVAWEEPEPRQAAMVDSVDSTPAVAVVADTAVVEVAAVAVVAPAAASALLDPHFSLPVMVAQLLTQQVETDPSLSVLDATSLNLNQIPFHRHGFSPLLGFRRMNRVQKGGILHGRSGPTVAVEVGSVTASSIT